MSTSVKWFKPLLAKDWTMRGFVEGWTNAAMELLIAVGLVLFVVGTPFLFLAGAIYLNSVFGPEHLPDLGQFYGP
jgi:hypothetical protein